MKKLLLIGGTGFFGKSFLDCFKRGMLAEWGVGRVLIMSRAVERLQIENPELLGENIELIKGDVGKTEILPKADYVIHAAASTDARSYLSSPEEEKKNILAATYNYCNHAKLVHRKSKILYISSGAVYGPQSDDLPFLTEAHPLDGLDGFLDGKRDYAFAKRDAENAIKELGFIGLSVSIARCFAFVGPYLPRNQHFAIGNFIQDGLMGRPIDVKADGKVYRSYMYADDLVEWLMTLMDMSGKDCPIFNVGSDQAVEIGELAQIMSRIFDVNINYLCKRTNNQDRYIPSIDKALSRGLRLKFPLRAAIEETIKRIKDSKNEWPEENTSVDSHKRQS